jgi:type VI secretion system VasD/TssJ family lipoprotein
VLACAGAPKPAQVCLNIQASPSLNPYGGQPHAVTLYLYPLMETLGFQQTSTDDLLEGANPTGASGPRVPITISPGETRAFEEAFPPTTPFVGIVVGYYRAPGDSEGTRKVVVAAKCGRGSPSVVLSPRDVVLY